MTANWQENPVYDQPAGALLRLRVVNTDTTRIHKLYLTTTDARIIAWDGHPVRDPIALPTALKPVFVGPGQRLDFALRMPDSEGCLLYTSPSPRDLSTSRMPSSA